MALTLFEHPVTIHQKMPVKGNPPSFDPGSSCRCMIACKDRPPPHQHCNSIACFPFFFSLFFATNQILRVVVLLNTLQFEIDRRVQETQCHGGSLPAHPSNCQSGSVHPEVIPRPPHLYFTPPNTEHCLPFVQHNVHFDAGIPGTQKPRYYGRCFAGTFINHVCFGSVDFSPNIWPTRQTREPDFIFQNQVSVAQ